MKLLFTREEWDRRRARRERRWLIPGLDAVISTRPPGLYARSAHSPRDRAARRWAGLPAAPLELCWQGKWGREHGLPADDLAEIRSALERARRNSGRRRRLPA